MRVSRFETFLRPLLAESPDVESVKTFADEGVTDPPYGLIVRLRMGSTMWFMIVGSSPPGGDDWTKHEPVIEGEPLTPVEVPRVDAPSGRLATADIEGWLAALIQSGGSREIARVRRFSLGEGSRTSNKVGLAIDMHSGRKINVLFWYSLRSGDGRTPGREHQIPQHV